jgi:hypothetical protein
MIRSATKRIGGSRFATGFLGVAVGALVVAGGVAFGAPTAPQHYAGCLSASSGTFYNIASGTKPTAACATGDKKIALGDGDVTSVTAGSGLTGGTAAGPSTLSIDPSYLAANAVTGITPGAGLTANGSVGNLTLGLGNGYVLPQGCSGGQIVQHTSGPLQKNAWQCAAPPKPTQAVDWGGMASGTQKTLDFGDLTLTASCGTAAGTLPLTLEVANNSGDEADLNMSWVTFNGQVAHDFGGAVQSPGIATPINADTNGGTGNFVWRSDNNIITGNLTWFESGSTCELEGGLYTAGA